MSADSIRGTFDFMDFVSSACWPVAMPWFDNELAIFKPSRIFFAVARHSGLRLGSSLAMAEG